MLEEADSYVSNVPLTELEENFCPTFTNDIALLLQELNNDKHINITLNHINEKDKIKEVNERKSPFELTALRTFAQRSLNRHYKISPLIATILHDGLDNTYKQNGKYDLPFEHFNKAISYTNNDENIRTKFTRKVSGIYTSSSIL
jgi:hypothetical protein